VIIEGMLEKVEIIKKEVKIIKVEKMGKVLFF
jgi:hypothetical protein